MKKLLLLVFIISLIFSFSCKKEIGSEPSVTISEDITSNTTWTKDEVYLISGTVEVKNNAVLTIEPGTTIKFDKNAELDVGSSSYGTVIAKGTASEPITFTSNTESKSKGDYYGIWLFDGANNCEFEYCTFEYGGGYAKTNGEVNLLSTNASFKNCTFTQSAGYGIYVEDGGFKAFSANTFSNNANNPIYIYGNYVQTIGTGNSFDAGTFIDVYSDDINKSGTLVWKNHKIAYQILGDISIGSSSGTTVKIEPGCVLKFTKSAEFSIGGTDIYGAIDAQGTATDSIFFTSSAASPTNGDWYGLWFYSGTESATKFDYCHIAFAGGYDVHSGNFNLYNNETATVSISNTTISNSAGYGIYVSSGQTPPSISSITYYNNSQGNYYVEP